ncbi:bifunctional DNA-formamidopyrimidine glycosylase/DNA-(apurinic or apyrimidinic site) lyase [Actinomycetaceae bacterium TAE3-ERU4]|nr:bifunctional DNA-formamidopyrimidine glycosylase/DNA-(apurinic or apyrimidinic site) lyase [Actinomycetaceae bacterium TAE3-ERU4]
MPELPEAETVRKGLAARIRGCRIEDVEIFVPRIVRSQPGGQEEFVQLLRGRVIKDVARRGKFMWSLLDDGNSFVFHLGMSGQFRFLNIAKKDPLARHERARFFLSPSDEGKDSFSMSFIDQRIFGSLAICETVSTTDGFPAGYGTESIALPVLAAHIARDILDPAFETRRVVSEIRKRRSAIKTVLLNQSIVSGFGNIYADEALFLSGVHGARLASSLSAKKIEEILVRGRELMLISLEKGGTSFDSLYVDINGNAGTYAQSLRVYGRSGKPCSNCATQLQSAVMGGRSHVYCIHCQKPPRGFRQELKVARNI